MIVEVPLTAPQPVDPVAAYEANFLHRDAFTARLATLLRDLLAAEGIDTHALEHRTKSSHSFREKIGRAGKTYTDPLAEITDLSGLRVVVYYDDDIPRVAALLRRELAIDDTRSITSQFATDPDRFGYQSLHYIAALSEARGALREWRDFRHYRAEIQVRTVLQHAWAGISHKLQYKREADVPAGLRRQLMRLSALLEIADNQFVSLRDAMAEVVQTIATQVHEGDAEVPLSLPAVESYFASDEFAKDLRRRAFAVGFSFEQFDNAAAADESPSDLVLLANSVGLATVGALRSALVRTDRHLDNYLSLQLNAGQRKASRRPWQVSPAFIAILLLIGLYPRRISVAQLRQLGWSSDIARDVLRIAADYTIAK